MVAAQPTWHSPSSIIGYPNTEAQLSRSRAMCRVTIEIPATVKLDLQSPGRVGAVVRQPRPDHRPELTPKSRTRVPRGAGFGHARS